MMRDCCTMVGEDLMDERLHAGRTADLLSWIGLLSVIGLPEEYHGSVRRGEQYILSTLAEL